MGDSAVKMWLATPFGKYVQSYCDGGFYVFPCHGIDNALQCTCGKKDCPNAGKHPACKNGHKDATKDAEEAATLFNLREDLNVGIVCGAISNIFILDIDPRNGGNESLIKLQDGFGDLPECPMVNTGGGGQHLVFNYPDVKIKSGRGLADIGFPGIDKKGDGSYVVWPPSKHISGNLYTFAEGFFDIQPPNLSSLYRDFLKDKPKAETPFDRNASSGNMPEISENDVVDMLNLFSPDMGRDEWIAIGMAIHREGLPLYLWDDWSRGGKKYVINEPAKCWKGFNRNGARTIATLIEKAKLKGWKPKPQERAPRADGSIVEGLVKKATPKVNGTKAHIPSGNKFDPLHTPGLIGDTVRWICKHSIFPQPELALLNTLAFAGAVLGRRYMSPTGTMTNIFTVGIADTSMGKEKSIQAINLLAADVGLGQYIGSNNIRSAAGLVRELSTNACRLLMIGEFGLFMQTIGNDKAPSYKREITELLLDLYSKADSVYLPGAYADMRTKEIELRNPILCIFGTTTLSSYSPALNKRAIDGGNLGRFIVLSGRDDIMPDHEAPVLVPDDSLVARWKEFAPAGLGELANTGIIMPKTLAVSIGECEQRKREILNRQTEMRKGSKVGGVWGRYWQNCLKIATIFSALRDQETPIITAADFDIAESIVSASAKYMEKLAAENMSETPYEAAHQEVLNFIKLNPGVNRTALLRKFRKFKKKEQEEILLGLIEQEEISVDRPSGVQGAPLCYRVI